MGERRLRLGMAKANINDRASLERVYPADIFASDAARNGRVASEVISGVRILSAPDDAGDFEFERATRQVGEAASPAFLAPQRREDRLVDADRDRPTAVAADPDPRQEYDGFLDDLIAAARRVGFNAGETPGRDEPRLRGLRQ